MTFLVVGVFLMQEEWGPWVQHDGGGCPVAAGTVVEVVSEDRFGYLLNIVGQTDGDSYSSWDWQHFPELKKIIRYREKKPKGLQILQEVLNELDVPTPSKPVDVREKT